jgi:tRNA pseudouridine32 synthase/23S rRNA pseudouridine746 synthase
VVIKPAGLLSVPGRFVKDCVLHRLQMDYPLASIVHRLDLDTSGIMVLALNKQTLSHLAGQFRNREVSKCYEAIVFGVVEPDSASINKPVARDWQNRPRQVIDPFYGKQALTHLKVLDRYQARPATRLQLTPVTGRSHQLRLHLASISHPIIGCDLYAHEQALKMADRLLLHATSLAFNHPITGERLRFDSTSPF